MTREDFGLFLLRLTGLGLALVHGLPKVTGLATGASQLPMAVEKLGFPLPTAFAWAAALGEFLGGLLVALGLFTRVGAAFAAFTMFVAAFLQHHAFSRLLVSLRLRYLPDDTLKAWGNPELALMYLAVMLGVLIMGPGRIAFDSVIGKRGGDSVARLGVNIDHVATVRQARRAQEPDPVHAAVLAELGGAGGITVHLRQDRRHIQDRDLEVLRQVVRTRLNLEMAATQEMLRVAMTVKPEQATLVPERREELTTEGGLDAVLNSVQLKPIVKTLVDAGIGVSLFVDPDLEQVKEAHKLDAQAVELNTASYADARDAKAREAAMRRIVDAARLGRRLGLLVHAGHGLTYQNVGAIAAQSEIGELNIGHSIVSRALLVGMERAVREMVEVMRGGPSR